MRDKQLMTTGDVARYCGVNFRTVIRWIDKGRISAFKLPGRGDNRITVDSFLSFLNENNMPIPDELAAADPVMVLLTSQQNLACDLAGLVRRENWRMKITNDPIYFGFLIANKAPNAIAISDEAHLDIVDKMVKESKKKDSIKILLSEQNKISPLRTGWEIFRWPTDPHLLSGLLAGYSPNSQKNRNSQRAMVN